MHLFTAQSYKWNDSLCTRPMCSVCEIDIDMSVEPMKRVRMGAIKPPRTL